MANAQRDQNNIPTLLCVSNVDGTSTVTVYADPVTHRLLVDLPSGTGTVTSVSVVSANGFAGSVATATSTPAITLSTTVTGFLQGNGTAISAATTTGSGSTLVLATSPTLVTPLLGTPTSGNLVNCTGYTVANVAGLGTGVATFLATPSSSNLASAVTDETGSGALVFANTPTLVTPILGTPTSGTLTNCTGYTVANISGLGANVATFLGTPSSANLAAAVTDETGSGALVFGTNPTIAKPVLNATNPTAQTYTPGVGATATLDLSLANQHYVTFPAGNITLALSNDTNNQVFLISLTQDSGGSRTVTWFTTIRWAGGSTPTLTTTANKRDTFGFIRTGSGTYDGFVVGQNI